MRSISLAMVGMAAIGFGRFALACSQHGTEAVDITWSPGASSGGVVEGLLSLETGLVAPTSSTTCTAGIGLGTLDNPLPAGFAVTDMEIGVMNTVSGSHTPLSAFSFVANGTTSSSLAAGSGSSSVPGTNPLFAGSTWFGFASAVDPFSLPVLGPDEVTALLFTLEAPEHLLPLALDVQFAGGEGEADGTPIFSGDHPAQYFTAADPTVEFTEVPEPGTVTLMAMGLLGLVAFGWRQRHR